MNELAFGNQVLQERGNNAHIKRMPEIEQFALDNYKALAERIGEKNIIPSSHIATRRTVTFMLPLLQF